MAVARAIVAGGLQSHDQLTGHDGPGNRIQPVRIRLFANVSVDQVPRLVNPQHFDCSPVEGGLFADTELEVKSRSCSLPIPGDNIDIASSEDDTL